MIRPFLIDLNPVELKLSIHGKYLDYPFMISLDKCNGSCNTVDDLSTKACVPSKTKDVNVKVSNMITNRNKAKTLVIKQISCDFKCNFNGTTCKSNQTWSNETCQCECYNYHKW